MEWGSNPPYRVPPEDLFPWTTDSTYSSFNNLGVTAIIGRRRILLANFWVVDVKSEPPVCLVGITKLLIDKDSTGDISSPL